jgi:hypothetical protein
VSNALAVATVTRALAHVVERAARKEVSGAEVLTARPEGAVTEARIHLFLYQVSHDPHQRNGDLPSRTGSGTVRQRPTAALVLHYLLSFHGNERSLEPHRMLGAVARDLHAEPILTRGLVRSVSTGDLEASNLADAPDVVRVTPLPLNAEDLSKIWMMFSQIPYSLSVAYEARVVLIEAEEAPTPAPPVLRRGDEDRGAETVLGPFPLLDGYEIGRPDAPLSGARLPSYPSAALGLRLRLRGSNLGGDTVTVRFSHPRFVDDLDVVVPPADRTADEVRLVVPSDAAAEAAWAAGLYGVTVRVTHGTTTRASNALPLPFAPIVAAIAPPSPVAGAGTDLTLTVTSRPRIAAGQRATLFVGGLEAVAAVPSAATDTLAFTFPAVPAVAGALVRLRVDGVESHVFREEGTPPALVLDDTKRISIV